MKHISELIEEYMNREELKKFVKDMKHDIEKPENFYIEFQMPRVGSLAEGQVCEVLFEGDWDKIGSLIRLVVLQGWPIAEG